MMFYCFVVIHNIFQCVTIKITEPSMQMCMLLSRVVSSPFLIRSLVLMSFMLLKLYSTIAVVTGRTAKIIANYDRLVKGAAMSP